MDINATLILQMIAFAVFVWVTMKLALPPISKAMKDREVRIADGLAAAEKGSKALQDASTKSDEALKAARVQAQEIVGAANKQATQIVEQARQDAESEKTRIVASGHAEVQREIAQAKDALRRQVSELAVAGASKILHREIDAKTHADVLNELAAQV
ncbi:MAG: F0F1 ATP synthase subunit B [Nevskia sp.]|nr:F0F1 ATP synthase subunit B [Nevskia sp.]